jgi:hypothetical protein
MWNDVILHRKLDLNLLASNKFYYLLFAAISAVITSLNIGGPYIIHFIDITWPLNPVESILTSFNMWSYSSYGYVNGINIFNFQYFFAIALLSYFPVYIQEFVLLTILQFIGAVYTYKIFKEFIFKNDSMLTRILSFSAAFPVVFSNYYWWDFIPIGFFLISFGVMFLYYSLAFLDDYDKNNEFNYKYIFLMGIASMLSFSSSAPVNANLIILALIMPLFVISRNVRKRKIIIFYSIMLSIVLFTNLWWIIPSYMAVLFTTGSVSSFGGSGNVYVLILNSYNANFFNVLEFVHTISPYFGLSGSLKINNIVYGLSVYMSMILLFFAVGSFVYPKEKLRKGYFLSVFFVLLLDLVMMGINSPLKSMEVYLIDNNGILSEYLRGDPGTLYLAFFFILTITITVSLYVILKPYIETHRNRKSKAIVVLVLLLLIFSFIAIAPQNYDGYAVPHYPYRSRMVVPSFDKEVATFIENNSGQHYTLLYPSGFLEQNVTNGYDAYDILPSMIPQSLVISGTGGNVMLENIYNYIGSSTLRENFAYYLYSENIKYVVVEGDIGGTYPFGFYPPPDYNDILSHLNSTVGIKLVKRMGPDYIYSTDKVPDGMVSKAAIFSNSSIIDGDIIPLKNITYEYYEDTFSNRTVYEPNATYNGGINVNINKTSWNIISNLSYKYTEAEPIFYNSIPLNINTSIDSVLVVKLTGNNGTVLTPQLLTSSNITLYSILNQSTHIPTGYPYNIRGNNNTARSEYGGDHFLMSNKTLTMYILINKADPDKIIHYLYFSLEPLNKNLYGIGNLTFTIQSIELCTYFGSAYGMFLVNNSFDYNYNYTMNYTQTGYTDYYVSADVTNGSGPLVLSLFTAYSPYWAVKGVSGISSYRLIRLDTDTTGIVIYPEAGHKNLEFYIYYGPQNIYVSIEHSLIILYTVFFLSMIAMYKKEEIVKMSRRLGNIIKGFKKP